MRILSSGVESAARIMCFIVLPIIKLENVLLDHKLE
jgi:hypothetical protein